MADGLLSTCYSPHLFEISIACSGIYILTNPKSIGSDNSLQISSSADTEGANSTFAYIAGFSDDGQQVFFVVSTTVGNNFYRVPMTGGTSVKVAGPILPSAGVQLTKDEQYIVYATHAYLSNEPARLFSLDIATGQSIALDEVQIDGGFSGFYWALTPEHTGAIYFGKKEGSKKQLYYVPLTGGTPAVLNVDYAEMDPPLVSPAVQPVSYNGQTCVVYGFRFSNSSSYRSLYASCFGGSATPQQNVYLPLISQ